MNRMLAYEKYKILKSKYFWVCSIVLAVVTILPILALSLGSSDFQDSSNGFAVRMFAMSVIRPLLVGQNSLFIAIVIGILIGSDFSDGTIKNIMSKGISRREFVISKFIIGTILGIILIIIKLVVGYVSGLLLLEFSNIGGNFWKEIIQVFLVSLLQTMAYVSIFMLCGFLIRKSGGAIAMGIGLTIVVPLLVTIATALNQFYFVNATKINFNLLIPNGLSVLNVDKFGDILSYSLAMIIYIVGGFLLSTCLFEKNDIK